MSFVLGSKSRKNLEGVHPHLVRVVERAIQLTPVDFTVFEGVRTLARQKQLVKDKKSKTLNSRHIPGADGYGKAVDLVPLVGGKPSWDSKIIKTHYVPMAEAVKKAAKELGVPIRWGGDWNNNGNIYDETFFDGPHFELPSIKYP